MPLSSQTGQHPLPHPVVAVVVRDAPVARAADAVCPASVAVAREARVAAARSAKGFLGKSPQKMLHILFHYIQKYA